MISFVYFIHLLSTEDQSLPVVRIQQDVVALKRFACNTCRLSLSRVVWQLPFFAGCVVGVFAGLFISSLVLFW